MNFQLFRKRKKRKNASSRASGKYFSQAAKYAAHARFAIGGNFLLAVLGSCAEYRRLITGRNRVTHIYFFFVRGTFHTTALQPFYSARARWLRQQNRNRSRAACFAYVSYVCVRLFEFVLPRCIFCADQRTRYFREKTVYIQLAAIE